MKRKLEPMDCAAGERGGEEPLLRRSDDLEQAMVWSRKVSKNLDCHRNQSWHGGDRDSELYDRGNSSLVRGLVITFQLGGSENLAPTRVDLGEGNAAPNVAIVQFVIGRCFNSLPVARLGDGEKLCSWLVFSTNAQQTPERTIDFCYPCMSCPNTCIVFSEISRSSCKCLSKPFTTHGMPAWPGSC